MSQSPTETKSQAKYNPKASDVAAAKAKKEETSLIVRSSGIMEQLIADDIKMKNEEIKMKNEELKELKEQDNKCEVVKIARDLWNRIEDGKKLKTKKFKVEMEEFIDSFTELIEKKNGDSEKVKILKRMKNAIEEEEIEGSTKGRKSGSSKKAKVNNGDDKDGEEKKGEDVDGESKAKSESKAKMGRAKGSRTLSCDTKVSMGEDVKGSRKLIINSKAETCTDLIIFWAKEEIIKDKLNNYIDFESAPLHMTYPQDGKIVMDCPTDKDNFYIFHIFPDNRLVWTSCYNIPTLIGNQGRVKSGESKLREIKYTKREVDGVEDWVMPAGSYTEIFSMCGEKKKCKTIPEKHKILCDLRRKILAYKSVGASDTNKLDNNC